MSIGKNNTIKYFVILFIFCSFILIPKGNVRAVGNERWYSGYSYDDPVNYPWGVKANIYRINPGIPLDNFLAEWVSVIISYHPKYWIQSGYLLEFTWLIFPIFLFNHYVETWDVNGQDLDRFGSPLSGHHYTYAIWWETSKWRYAVLEGDLWHHWGYRSTNPSDGIDYQAFVETTTPSIWISGSHFYSISYYDLSSPVNWYYWNDHDPYWTYPYWIDPRSDYEFYASGGS